MRSIAYHVKCGVYVPVYVYTRVSWYACMSIVCLCSLCVCARARARMCACSVCMCVCVCVQWPGHRPGNQKVPCSIPGVVNLVLMLFP